MNLYRESVPHRGYEILRKWREQSRCGYMALTTNVDGHFQKSGFDARVVTECHGSIHFLQSMLTGHTDCYGHIECEINIRVRFSTF